MGEKMSGKDAFVVGKCNTCKDVTRHTVLAWKDDKPGRVRCFDCRDEHNFRAPPPSKEERARITAERLRLKKIAEDCERWAELRPNMLETKAKDYSMDGLFKKKDIIKHPVFGLGQVQKTAGPHKVEVLFEGGTKVMRCQ
jgi:hypothetical protein